jgi:apolipoprotein N-acyltransferase
MLATVAGLPHVRGLITTEFEVETICSRGTTFVKAKTAARAAAPGRARSGMLRCRHMGTQTTPRMRVLLALLSAALLAGGMPGEVSPLLAWVALAPLAAAVDGLAPLPAGGIGLLAGVANAAIAFRWMAGVAAFGPAPFLLLALWLGAFPALWCAGLALAARAGLPLLAAAPLLWAALEWARAHAGWLALPWGSLAQAQHADLPLLQLAALAGEPGISFVVAAAGVGLWRAVAARRWREAAAVAALVAAAHAGGALALARPAPDLGRVRVALVQPAILAKERETRPGYDATLDRLAALTRSAGAQHPALVVWPETAVRDLPQDAPLRTRLARLASDTGAPILAGSSSTEKLVALGNSPPAAPIRANEAVLVLPGGVDPVRYRKTLLVPFAERPPPAAGFPWPRWLVSGTYGLAPGAGPRTLLLPDGTPLTVVICWENLFSSYVRTAVGGGARLLVVLTNDTWAGASAAPLQHDAASALRAAETGVPVLTASNGGPSTVVDGRGRTLARAGGVLTRELVTADVPLAAATTPYARFGDPLAFALVAAAAGALALVARRARA